MVRISYWLRKEQQKLKKRRKLKTLRISNATIFQTTLNKLTKSGNIIHSIFNYALMGVVSILRLPKEEKNKNI